LEKITQPRLRNCDAEARSFVWSSAPEFATRADRTFEMKTFRNCLSVLPRLSNKLWVFGTKAGTFGLNQEDRRTSVPISR